jgi:hypothetical protein
MAARKNRGTLDKPGEEAVRRKIQTSTPIATRREIATLLRVMKILLKATDESD